MKKGGISAIVPAAGIGKRFGAENKKPFYLLNGRPVLIWSLMAIESVPDITEIIPVLKEQDMALGLKVIEDFGLSKVRHIAPGGPERQDSVWNGLKLLGKDTKVVLIHDGARPLIEKPIMEETIRALNKDLDGVIAAVPLKDTIKEADGKKIIKQTLKRDLLWAVQTPQTFKYNSIMNAYKKALSEGFYSTDDSALVERYGGKVKIIMGSYKNIKITGPEDVELAEIYIKKEASI